MESLSIEEIVERYLDCALWVCTDDDFHPLNHNYGIDDISEESKELARSEITTWLKNCHEKGLIAPFIKVYEDSTIYTVECRLGYDFWYSRNRYSTGFWDRNELGDLGEKLSDASEMSGGCYLYVGDDDILYF